MKLSIRQKFFLVIDVSLIIYVIIFYYLNIVRAIPTFESVFFLILGAIVVLIIHAVGRSYFGKKGIPKTFLG
jgi:hypothetical protein